MSATKQNKYGGAHLVPTCHSLSPVGSPSSFSSRHGAASQPLPPPLGVGLDLRGKEGRAARRTTEQASEAGSGQSEPTAGGDLGETDSGRSELMADGNLCEVGRRRRGAWRSR
ncbi:hypothetical protein [Oryza sativa Japonica Group]|uniref:Uncharacterized protein n=1 Tax=Oryza sativa subsp. japonica TaxID=39947 RepID=Q656H7_ORYSJ|nr:hypothetical protein [Oryza sativa Japonica Group]